MKPLKGKRLKCQAMQVLNVGDSKICAPLHYGGGLTLLLLSNSLSDLILLIQSWFSSSEGRVSVDSAKQ